MKEDDLIVAADPVVSRVVKRAEEEERKEEDDRTVTSLGKLHVTESVATAPDSFKTSGEDIKKFVGTTGGFKRRVTNDLKKVNQSFSGDARSKQIEESFTGYDVFGVVEPPYNLDYLAKLYEKSVPHAAAVEAKVSNIVGLGYKFVETNSTKRLLEDQQEAGDDKKLKKTLKKLSEHRDELEELFEDFNEESTFTETLIRVWRDYETMGNAYIEIARKSDGTIGYIGHIPAQTMRVRRVRDGYVQISGNKVQFFAKFKTRKPGVPLNLTNPIGDDVPNQVIHLVKSTPTNAYYGVPNIISAQQAVAGNEFLGRFNLDYFENKAIPRHLIILKGAKLGNRAETDLLQFFETNLKGVHHRSLFIPLPGDVKDGEKVDFDIKPIEAGVQDASFVNLKKMNDKDIYTSHRVPETKVSISGGGVNIAVAKDADKTFKEQVCAPEQSILERKLNGITKEFTDAYLLDLAEMTLTDEDTQSKIDERNVKAGVDLPNEVRARRGLPHVDGGNERTDLNAKDKIAQAQAEERTNRERNATRSAQASDSNGESRNAKGEGRTTA